MKNLREVLGRINSHPYAVRAEQTLEHQHQKEIRTFCKMPCPEDKLPQPPTAEEEEHPIDLENELEAMIDADENELNATASPLPMDCGVTMAA